MTKGTHKIKMNQMKAKEKKLKITSSEKRILAAYNRDEFQSIQSPEQLENLRSAARATTLKDQRINIRMSSDDLRDIREIAREEGLPYQSLIASILHKYVTGRLIERKRDRKTLKRAR